MAALLAHEGTAPITCRLCGEPIPLPFTSTASGNPAVLTMTVDGAALRAHMLLTHGITADDDDD